MFINSLFLAIASSIDSFGIGITYGIKNTKISKLSKIVLFLISFFTCIISIWFGNFFKNFLPDFIADFIGSGILIFMGLFFCFQALHKSRNELSVNSFVNAKKTDYKNINDNKSVNNNEFNNIKKDKSFNIASEDEAKIYSFFIKFLGITIKIIKNPNSSDFDKSNCIDSKEALFLGIALSLDSFCICLGFGMLNFSHFIFPFLVSGFQFLFLSLGNIVGNKLYKFSKIPDNVWSIISGILLIVIGILR